MEDKTLENTEQRAALPGRGSLCPPCSRGRHRCPSNAACPPSVSPGDPPSRQGPQGHQPLPGVAAPHLPLSLTSVITRDAPGETTVVHIDVCRPHATPLPLPPQGTRLLLWMPGPPRRRAPRVLVPLVRRTITLSLTRGDQRPAQHPPTSEGRPLGARNGPFCHSSPQHLDERPSSSPSWPGRSGRNPWRQREGAVRLLLGRNPPIKRAGPKRVCPRAEPIHVAFP